MASTARKTVHTLFELDNVRRHTSSCIFHYHVALLILISIHVSLRSVKHCDYTYDHCTFKKGIPLQQSTVTFDVMCEAHLAVCIYLLWSHGNKWSVKMMQWLTAMIFFIDTDVDYINAREYRFRAIAIDLYIKMGRFRAQIIQKVRVSLCPVPRKCVTN